MKKPLSLIVVIVISLLYYAYEGGFSQNDIAVEPRGKSSATVDAAHQQQKSDVQVEGVGVVIKVLPDDLKGSRHQKFILRLASGNTILVAHNIDLAPRIPNLKKGDTVGFFGEYEWNNKGGVVHWTHHDPRGKHLDGWLESGGKRYQ